MITDAAHAVELDWQAATAAGANNGSVALWIDQVAAGSVTTLDNDTRAIDTARLGAVAGLDAGTTGTLYFDAFEDRRVPTTIGAEASLPDRLFTNSFESNSLANWVVSGPGITTTTAANLAPGQSIGAAVAVTSTQTTRYLEDLTPNRESRYRARVYFDPNGLTMAVNNSFNLLNIYTGTTEIGRLEFQYVASGYRLRAAVRNDASLYTTTPWTTLTDSAHVLEIDWRAATGPGANDGGLTLWIDGTQVGALSGVDNDTRRVDRARIGGVGLDAGTTGTFYLDAFESRRESAIGPVQVAGNALTTTAIAYGYDPLYRLTSATYSDGTLFGYAYDAVGNVLTKTQTIAGTPTLQTYAYDDANRQTSAAGLAQTYDNNGNLTHDGATAYTWDGANRMTASGSTAYTYNGLNDRVSVAGVAHQLDLNTGLTQVLADGTNTYLYGAGRLGEQQGSAWQYHLADGLGSVRQLADASGTLSAAKSYEPYGEVLSSAGTASSAYGFTGEQMDASGKLVYLRARYYQAEAMRFMSRDSWPGVVRQPHTLNRWGYTSGNPSNFTDPTGHCSTCEGTRSAFVGGNPQGGFANVRERPTINSNIVDQLKVNTRVLIYPSGGQKGPGPDGDSSLWRRVLYMGAPMNRQTWISDKFLVDSAPSAASSPISVDNYVKVPSSMPQTSFRFTAEPVQRRAGSMQMFGPTKNACDECLVPNSAGCPYNWLRGLHNGIDFPAEIGAEVTWTGNQPVTVAGIETEPGQDDGGPNIRFTVDGGLQVNFAHVVAKPGLIVGSSVSPGDVVASVFDDRWYDHLHVGVRVPYSTHFNPAYFFPQGMVADWPQQEMEGAWNEYSMVGFSLPLERGGNWFWTADRQVADQSGIVWGDQ